MISNITCLVFINKYCLNSRETKHTSSMDYLDKKYKI